jgi:protoporphyrinogen oxidase
VLERGLGATICRDFYFPYAVKIWGIPPEEISADQALRRVSAGSLGKMARKALALVPGFRGATGGRFFYPRQGYGQISRAIAEAARGAGAEIRLSTAVRRVHFGSPHRLDLESAGQHSSIEAEHVWSTIPLTTLTAISDPTPPASVLEASRQIDYRAMVLVYLVLGQEQFTQFDAHYFPEAEVRVTRLSEPRNYSGVIGLADRTVLCAELPCSFGDEVWGASDAELGELVRDSLARCGLPVEVPVLRVETRRLAFAYPIYRLGYDVPFALLDEWADGVEGLLTFGRQGLFAHDNTHHALAMAYAAVDCLESDGTFSKEPWRRYRADFARHVVED